MYIYAIAIAIFLWTVWGYFSSRVEHAKYSVVRKMDGYEIREYPAHIVAQTTVSGAYDEALNRGFRIVAGYIFGANVKKERVAMTAPVTSQDATSQTIAMTAPVQAAGAGASRTISFVMPRTYSIESLPTPTDERVKIVSVPAKKFAALRFSWYWTDTRIRRMQKKLLAALERDGIVTSGEPMFAGYNAPLTPPWMVRNEVMIETRDA